MVILLFEIEKKFEHIFHTMTSKTLLIKYFHIAFVVGLYWITSITSVFVNKSLLSNDHIEAPYFVLWYQCFCSVVICICMKHFSGMFLSSFSFPRGSPFRREAVITVLPVSVLLTSMIIFNALCLKYGGVSFYYIGRSLTTIFNVLLTFLMIQEKVSGKTILCCCLIVFGFFLGVDQESVLGTFSLKATLSGVLASLSVALYSVYTKKVLPFVDNSIWALSYYNNAYSCVLLIPFIVCNEEIPKFMEYKILSDPYLWLLLTIGGVFGFTTGYVTSLQIKVTSPLTHNISGTAKACVQTVMATLWYNEDKSILWWISNYIILIGSFLYARVKQIEMKRKEEILK